VAATIQDGLTNNFLTKEKKMGEKKPTPIIIDDVEYQLESMTTEQQLYISHITDLERKINSTKFNLDQLLIGKEAFIKILKDSLNQKVEGEANVNS
jgi:hypothetical protein